MIVNIIDDSGRPVPVFEDCPSEGQLVPYTNKVNGTSDPLIYFECARGGADALMRAQ